MSMTAFDKWLTTDTREDSFTMDIVELEGLVSYQEGMQIPLFIDELTCEDCDGGIGWSSDGTFTEFYTDSQEKHYKCEDCHDEWRSVVSTESE